jgi:hypothetical protein
MLDEWILDVNFIKEKIFILDKNNWKEFFSINLS